MTVFATLGLLLAGLALCGFCLWHQQKPRTLGDVPWFPSTLVLGLGILLVILALAHLVSLWTGHPLKGRGGL
jgi:uncharacterized iron-regulated membrane protein